MILISMYIFFLLTLFFNIDVPNKIYRKMHVTLPKPVLDENVKIVK